ncbi:hypothetical protein N657DRAFT_581882 [Parathielavia appendiculata]|uniref:Uncharacterized protein n=1 Tax=Parathielavia appendiculata TaxID=2587402 RepID=A0AAN6TRD0_9PEZI|nr:hypothetical protein N657DRAFT_581882 [Parathielavia appendiculata]
MSTKPERAEARAAETGHDIIHGAGQEQSTRVSRADKTAPMPEPSKGAGLQKTSGSAGQSLGTTQGGRNRTN